MATYFFQATDRAGKFVEGDVEAVDFRLAVEKVRKLNYYPIKVTTEAPRRSTGWADRIPWSTWLNRVSQKELQHFTQQLSTLLASGLTLDRSLVLSARLAEKESTREVLSDIQKRVHSGSTFADALAVHPAVFSKMYVSMIRAGELGGVLETVLKRLGDFLEKSQDMKSKVLSAMIYPIILILAGGGAVIFLMTSVIPKFNQIFADMGGALPWVTRVLLQISALLSHYWWLLLLGGLVLIGGIGYYLKTEEGRRQWDALMLKTPVIGDLIRKIEVSRFSRTMATLLQSGVPILQALQIVKDIINNRVIADAMGTLREGLKGGRGISKPLQKIEVFPPMAVQMVVVGEETGALEEMLNKVADTYDKEVDTALRRAVGLIGPAMILVLGLAVAFIVISLLWGMLSISDIIV